MLTDSAPPKVNAWSDPGSIAEAFEASATWAEPIFKAAVPNAFESLIRTRSPPMVGRTIMRTVWFSNMGDAGSPGNGSGACTAVLQALTQCSLLLEVSAQAVGFKTAARTIVRTACADFVFRTLFLPWKYLRAKPAPNTRGLVGCELV